MNINCSLSSNDVLKSSAFLVNDLNGNNPLVFKYNQRSLEPTPSHIYTSMLQSSPTEYDSQLHPDILKRLGRGVNDQMTVFLNRSVIVAHIANGIALQAGLMDSSIPIEDVVGELLNLGSVGVSGIRSFQSDKVGTLTSNLKGIGNKLKVDNDIIVAEQSVFQYNELCTTPLLVQNATEILPNDDFFNELGAILNSSLDETVEGYNTTLNIIEEKLTKINKITLHSIKTIVGQRDVVLLFKSLPVSFQAILEYTVELEKTVKDLKSKKAIYGATSSFESLATLVHLRNVRKSIDDVIFYIKQSLEGNVNIVEEHIENIKTSVNEVQMMKLLISSRIHSVSDKKRYTSGFRAGIADLKQLETDVNDLWISTILNINQDDLHKLGKGLLPLFTASAVVKSLDDKLMPVSNSTVYHSLLNIVKLHSEVSSMTPNSFNTSEVLDKYRLCTKSLILNNYNLKPVEDFLKNVILLKNSIDAITEYVNKFNVVMEIKNDFDTFYNALAFKDINNVTQSEIDLPEVITNLNRSAIESLKERVSIVKQPLNDATKTNINALVNNMIGDKGTINDTNAVFDYELTRLKCLKEIADKSSNMAKAFQVIQKLRSMDQMLLDKVERVAATVGEVSKDLASIEVLPAQMKNDASNITEIIIQLPDSARTSLIIGQSANSLRNAYDLLSLEPSIVLLKSINRIVQAEISNISNTEERKNVSEQWGTDHAKDMAQLDAALAAVKTFSNKLNTANTKTIADYGVPLIELATIPDVKIGAAEKARALEILIDRNPKVKSLLGPIKETLDAIASLDLQFSSHKAQLESAPTAFEAIHIFLSQVLPTKYIAAPMLVTSGVDSGIPYWVWILIAVFTGLAIIGIFVVIIVLCMNKSKMKNKKKENKKKENKKKENKKKKEKRGFKKKISGHPNKNARGT